MRKPIKRSGKPRKAKTRRPSRPSANGEHSYAAEQALALIRPYMDGMEKPSAGNNSRKRHVKMGDDLVQVVRDSYHVFLTKGLVCGRCGAKATVARLEGGGSRTSKRKHFVFYTAGGVKMTADHVIPKALGGIDAPVNIQPMCETCNGEKAAFVPRNATLSFDMLADPSLLEGELAAWKLEKVFERLFPDFDESEWIREHLDGELEPRPRKGRGRSSA